MFFLHFIGVVLIIGGLARAAMTVFAWRDHLGSTAGLRAIAALCRRSLAVAAFGYVLINGFPTIPGLSIWTLAAVYFTASSVAGAAMQVAKAAGRVEQIPSRTLLFVFLDGFVVMQLTHESGALYTCMATAFFLAVLAWLVSMVARFIAGPLLARRRYEADLAMAAMDSPEGER